MSGLATLESVRLVTSGIDCEVEHLLGEGGQGSVYEVALRPGGGHFALKWYHREAATHSQWAALETLVDIGAPDPRFLWPIELAGGPAEGFGYLMRLREPRFHEMSDHMARRITPEFRQLATAGLELADSFLQLHSKGLCYRDISFGNVFLDPDTGNVLVCDVDNVGVDGSDGGVLGTHYFMAPEILRWEAMPSTRTDRFSLAVLLFYMFMLHHPLLGKRETEVGCLDAAQLARLLGHDPLFIFDPDDDTNRPVAGEQDNALTFWPLYPQAIRDLFTRSFTEGLRNPMHGRVTEGQWRSALSRLRDAVMTCQWCHQQCFYDVAATGPRRCCNPACRLEIATPPRLAVNGFEIVLDDGAVLYPHHLAGRRFDYSAVLASTARHPTYDVSGITNLGDHPWVATTASGATCDVPPAQTVRIAPGTRIDFGTVEGTIRG
jgi:DNA-binding helix-hairpin-helix protein with protein kinase domain